MLVESGHADPAAVQRLAEHALRAMHHHAVDEPIESIAYLIHPQAEMRLLVSHGRPLHGREAILAALQKGREAQLFEARVISFEWLDDSTSLTMAHARYALEQGGQAEGRVWWLDELRECMIWRVQVFKNEASARRAYAQSVEERASEPPRD